jgi:restriction endonuclease Mrr
MSLEFKSLRDILREARAVKVEAEVAPVISPLIAEPMPVEQTCESEERLSCVRVLDRFDGALRRLLEEIATEVLGRELLLAPVEIERIALRLRERFGFHDGVVASSQGDIIIDLDGAQVDASLGRRFRSAVERALA